MSDILTSYYEDLMKITKERDDLRARIAELEAETVCLVEGCEEGTSRLCTSHAEMDLRADLATAASVAADLRTQNARLVERQQFLDGSVDIANLQCERDALRAQRDAAVEALVGAERALTVAVRHACDMSDFDPGEHHVIKKCRAALALAKGGTR